MAARRIFEVAPNGNVWTLKERGAAGTIATYNTKADAVDAGRKYAAARAPSQLIIKRADGTIETEHTYGDDPYPPKG